MAGEDREAGASETLGSCEDALVVFGVSQTELGGEASLRGSGRRAEVPCLVQGVRRTRPFARRAARTLRPLRVAFRARNPWVRARFSRLGWKVLFMVGVLARGTRDAVLPEEQRRGKIGAFRLPVNLIWGVSRRRACG